MEVQGATQTWQFATPLTLELDIERGVKQSVSDGTFRIYNLSESTRSDIYQDWLEQSQKRNISLKAGYLSWTQNNNGFITSQSLSVNPNPFLSSPLPLIFNGQITSAYSQREGSNWVTTITAWDGGYGVTQGYISLAIPAGKNLSYAVTQLVAAMPGVTLGYVDPLFTGASFVFSRGRILNGSPWDILTDMAKFNYADVYIDLGFLYFVPKGASVPGLDGGLLIINSSTGLLETPMKQNTFVSFEMIFEPRLKVGQSVELESLESVTNGEYTVGGVSHSGIISDAVGGDLRTKVECINSIQFNAYGAIQYSPS